MKLNFCFFSLGNRVAPQLANELSLFSRELVDLLKTTHRCQLSFSRFIPAYHHHFGRQCRVADYGFTKLIELFEALPHTVQVSFFSAHYSKSLKKIPKFQYFFRLWGKEIREW